MEQNRKREIYFWLILGSLNFLLFLPAYIADMDRSSFFPWQSFWQNSILQIGKDLFYNRPNLDVFRWSIEFSLLLFLSSFLLPEKLRKAKVLLSFFFPFYLLLLFYQIYHQSFYAIYQTPPFFYNDWGLLKVGWKIFLHDFNGRFAVLLLLAILGLILIYFALRFLVRFLSKSVFSIVSKSVMLFFLLESLVLLFRWGYQAWPEHFLQFHIAPIIKNIKESKEAHAQMKAMDIPRLVAHQPYKELELKQWPNFFFIFIESYGRVLYDKESLRKDYLDYLPGLNQSLEEKGWHSRSILSTAPVSGGASWVSYSTFLNGFDFQNRGTYWALLNDTLFNRYQHFPRLLQTKGYRNYRLSAIGGSADMEIPWETYTQFYAVDEWILNEDFDYKGLLYGWGPSPPDQFSLNFANQLIREKQNGDPFTLFFITQNSHNPFLCPEEVAEDWRSLNDVTVNQSQDSRIFEKPNLESYQKSIQYQLEFIADFIQKEGRPEDIFVVVGDHQPPLFPKSGAGFETPLHIIAKDSLLLQQLEEQNFSSGLEVKDTSKYMKHEGFYSLFLHHLTKRYGQDLQKQPTYLPNGYPIYKK